MGNGGGNSFRPHHRCRLQANVLFCHIPYQNDVLFRVQNYELFLIYGVFLALKMQNRGKIYTPFSPRACHMTPVPLCGVMRLMFCDISSRSYDCCNSNFFSLFMWMSTALFITHFPPWFANFGAPKSVTPAEDACLYVVFFSSCCKLTQKSRRECLPLEILW